MELSQSPKINLMIVLLKLITTQTEVAQEWFPLNPLEPLIAVSEQMTKILYPTSMVQLKNKVAFHHP
jgi:hypothetical protein